MTEECNCCFCQHWELNENEGVNNLHCQKCIDLEEAESEMGKGILETAWKWIKD